MNIEEVRMGNYVVGDNLSKVYRVSGLLGNYIQIQPLQAINYTSLLPINSEGDTHVKRIILSNSWFQALGFKELGEGEFYLNDQNLWFRSGRNGYSVHSQHDLLCQIKSVHELQNLVYALKKIPISLR